MTFRTPLSLVFALAVEGLVLLLIIVVILIGVLGIFLPILPALFFFGLAAGIYSLLIRSGYSHMTQKAHPHIMSIFYKIVNSKLILNFMGLIKKIRQKKQKQEQIEVFKNGLILSGFNFTLFLIFFFLFLGSTSILWLWPYNVLLWVLAPLLLIFICSSLCAIVWYRFGQIISRSFKRQKAANIALVVLVSLLPLFLLLIIISSLLSSFSIFNNELVIVTFLGLVLISILAAIFEFLIVLLGAVTTHK